MKTKTPMSKERVLNVCKRINAGIPPSHAVNREGLAHTYFIAMRDSGIVFKTLDGKWQARLRIDDARYQDFLQKRKNYDDMLALKRVSRKSAKVKIKPRVIENPGLFTRLWNKLFNSK